MISSVNATTSTTPQSSPGASYEISSETFMKLLTAQLQNQDPLEPMTNQEMLTQIAQLSTVAQMTELNQLLENQTTHDVTDVSGLIGRRIEWYDEEASEMASGLVTKVQLGPDGWNARVGDQAVSIDAIVSAQ